MADNGDEMNKPHEDAYGGGDYSNYKGGEEDSLDFHQLEDSTQYNNNNQYATGPFAPVGYGVPQYGAGPQYGAPQYGGGAPGSRPSYGSR